MPGTPVTKQDIVNEFNSRVVAQINSLGSAQWHTGNPPLPSTPAGHIGPQSEPGARVVADITVDGMTPNNIYNILHGWAMELTRMRRVNAIRYRTVSAGTSGPWATQTDNLGTQTTRMSDHYMRYFPLPGGQPDAGTQMNWAVLQNFMNSLRTQVNSIRSSTVTLSGCHSSCHSNCHSSRNRR